MTRTPDTAARSLPRDDIELEGADGDALEPRRGRRRSPIVVALVAIVPLVAMAAIAIVVAGQGDRILSGLGHNPPPADELVVDRVQFHEGRRVSIDVVNPQSDPIVPALLQVDSAYVNAFEVSGGSREIESRGRRTIEFTYDWIEDDPYAMSIVSSSGVKTDIEIAAAIPAAEVTSRGLRWGAVIGMLVGFVPVALGMLWLPSLRRLSDAALAGFLAFTAGLLVFLAIDAAAEAFDTQARLIPALGGPGVVVMGIVVSMVGVGVIGTLLRRGATGMSRGATLRGSTLALLVAIGIGLHNFGEGLAIGTSFATGEASLAIALVVGFMIHNLTEGIGIASPVARGGSRLGVWRGLGLATVAGVPAVLGLWLGQYVSGPLFVTLCFAVASGAALHVAWEVVRSIRGGSTGLGSPWVQGGFAAGVLAMWATGILAG